MKTVAMLRRMLEELENAGHGYESWEVLIMSADRDDPILDDIEYRVCGIDDPRLQDPEAGCVFLLVELVSTGLRGRDDAAARIEAGIRAAQRDRDDETLVAGKAEGGAERDARGGELGDEGAPLTAGR